MAIYDGPGSEYNERTFYGDAVTLAKKTLRKYSEEDPDVAYYRHAARVCNCVARNRLLLQKNIVAWQKKVPQPVTTAK